MVDARTKTKVEVESFFLLLLYLKTYCGYPRWETTRTDAQTDAKMAWKPRTNRTVPARAASPDISEDDMEEWEYQSTGNQKAERPLHTTRPH